MVRVYSVRGMHDYVDIKDGVSYMFIGSTLYNVYRVFNAENKEVACVPYDNVFVIEVM